MVRSYNEDDIIVKQGDTNRCLYKVVSGSVALYLNYGTDYEYLIGVLSFPECFGEMTVLSARPCPYTVVAFNDVQILCIPQENFDKFIESDYKNAIIIMRTMAKSIVMMNMNMSLLLEEMKDLTEKGGVSAETVRGIAGRYAGISEGDAMCMEASEELPRESHPLDDLYLDGHKDFSGIIHPEYRRFLLRSKYICPLCLEEFNGYRIVQSKLSLDANLNEQRFDLRRIYDDFDPMWYELVTCPKCYFTTFAGQFDDKKLLMRLNFESALKDARRIVRLDFDGERDLELVFAQHYLALMCAPGSDSFRQITARLWTNLYWLYDDAGEKELAAQALQRAITSYYTILDRCSLTPQHKQRCSMVLAGLTYHSGNHYGAKQLAKELCKGEYRALAERLISTIEEQKKNGDRS